MNNSNSTSTRYFNVHTEAMGYLNNFEVRTSEKGNFTVVTFCMLEGDPEKADSMYVTVKVSCKKALAILERYAQDISNDAVKVFAGFRIAKLRAAPFVYPQNSQKAGQLGVNYSARLIKVMYLKIGDHVVDLPKSEAETKTDYGVPAAARQRPAPTPAPARAQAQQQQQASSDFGKACIVELSQDDPNFEATKQRLKDDGYKWQSDMVAWVLPEVVLQINDPNLLAKQQDLGQLGYSNFNGDGVTWRMAFGKAPYQTKPSNTALFDKPLVEELSKSHPNFEAMKDQLFKNGYRWSNGPTWMLKDVVLQPNPQLSAQQNELKRVGYTNPSNDGLTWEAASVKRRPNQNRNNSRQQYRQAAH